MTRILGMLFTLYLAVIVVRACMAAAIVLGIVGCAIGLLFRTKETVELLAGLFAIALFSRFPVPCVIIISFTLIAAALGNPSPPTGKG